MTQNELQEVKEALEVARTTFNGHSSYHALKGDPVSLQKAGTNQRYAEAMEKALVGLQVYMDRLDNLESEESLENIVQKGCFDQGQYDRKRGSARGQQITIWDDLMYWVARAAIKAVKGE